MGLESVDETEDSTRKILERMEITMNNLEQMSFDSINITDTLVTLIGEAREHANTMKSGNDGDREKALESIFKTLDQLLDTAFNVNNISHELEKETVFQRDTVNTIQQIIDFLYGMSMQ